MFEEGWTPLLRWEVEGQEFDAGVSNSPLVIRETQRMRYNAYVQGNGTVREKDLSERDRRLELERDRYDTGEAVYIVARHKQKVIGTVRLLPCEYPYTLGDDEELLGERFVLPERHPRTHATILPERTMEVTRWVAHPYKLPSGDLMMTQFLTISAAMIACRRLGRDHVVADMYKPAHDKFERAGWKSDLLVPNVCMRGGTLPVYVIIVEVREYPEVKTLSDFRKLTS